MTGRHLQDSRIGERSLARALLPFALCGLAIVIGFFGVLGGWAFYFPLASAAVASGVVTPEGSRRAVQHLEGGIISDILVGEGSYVRAGQPLIRLRDTLAKTQYAAYQSQWLRFTAIKERVISLQSGAKQLDFSKTLKGAANGDAELRLFLDLQAELFMTRRKAMAGRKAVFRSQRQQLQEQLRGLGAELRSNTQQLRLLTGELERLRSARKGILRESTLLEKERQRAEVEARTSRSRANILSVKQRIEEVRINGFNAENDFRDKLADELMRINSQLAQLAERRAASQDVLKRTIIAAPLEGTVVGLKYKTRGGVIQKGDTILTIVPAKEDLVISARLNPTDRDVVALGQRAQVHLVPYVQRNLPLLEGQVRAISADTFTDQRTGTPYYSVKIVIDRKRLKRLAPRLKLTPGMPAEVLILTGSRPAINYLVEPVLRSLNRAFRQK